MKNIFFFNEYSKSNLSQYGINSEIVKEEYQAIGYDSNPSVIKENMFQREESATLGKYLKTLDPHTTRTVLQIGTSFIPYVGPFISAGIGLYDAKTYYDEGDKKTAGLVTLFSVIPAVGPLTKLGLNHLGGKKLAEIAMKIAKGQKLTKVEMEAAKKIAENGKVIQQEVSKSLTRKILVPVATYGAAGVTYDFAFDRFYNHKKPDFEIPVEQISRENREAANKINFE